MATETRDKHLLAHDSSGDRLTLNVHAIVPGSRANGPGLRTVVWLQGCSRRCPGCFNPETHDHSPRQLIPPAGLVRHVQHMGRHCEGISVSGGEPLEQAPALLAFLRNIREQTSLSIVLFSGYTFEEMHDIPHGPEIVSQLDVLIAGRFVREQRLGRGLLGSANQRIHVLTDRYSLSDLQGTPAAEVTIDEQGNILLSGIDPPCLPTREERR